MFQLTADEKAEVVRICDHLARLKFSPVFPYAFTERGAIMVASVLNTQRAIQVSVFVVRAFVKLREMLATHKELAQKLAKKAIQLGFAQENRKTENRGTNLELYLGMSFIKKM